MKNSNFITDKKDSKVQVDKPSLFAKLALALVLIALILLTWQWLSTRQRFNEIEKSLSIKLDEYQTLNQQSLFLAKQADERSNQANARMLVLEQELAESHDQQEVLQTLYDQLAENREATAVAEVEQLLTIADQQLQLEGNVKSALLALEAAERRMEPLNLPRASQLREVLGLEIKNLRTLPQVDIPNLITQLDSLTSLCSTLPLLSERQPTLNAESLNINVSKNLVKTTQLSNLQALVFPIWNDIKNLITIERIDKPEPPLLSEDHAFYLRENLKLRLLTARIALLQHDNASYNADIKNVNSWLNQYFDTHHADTIKALIQLKKLSNNNIGIELPRITESLAAVNRYKLSLEKN